ncbi:MAG: hypothetical protein K0M47_16930, partial [Rhizobium sp.]|nr:hypothetical protein [Rhizobium sp.]
HPLPFVGFAQARMLSPDGLCKAYDNDGIGYVRAEGGAVLILRSSERVAREGDRRRAAKVARRQNPPRRRGIFNRIIGMVDSGRADIDMTKMIVDTAKPLGITVHDHIIIGRDGHASLRGLRLI